MKKHFRSKFGYKASRYVDGDAVRMLHAYLQRFPIPEGPSRKRDFLVLACASAMGFDSESPFRADIYSDDEIVSHEYEETVTGVVNSMVAKRWIGFHRYEEIVLLWLRCKVDFIEAHRIRIEELLREVLPGSSELVFKASLGKIEND